MFKFYRVKKLIPNVHSVQARLPEAYQKFANSLKLPPTPVHYIPNPNRWQIHEKFKNKCRVENRDIPIMLPVEADHGIWGGEGVIKGFIKEKPKRRRFPNYWIPNLKKTIVYSEILNKYMEVTVTERTLRLIDQYCGFDHYILGSPVQDLKSQLAITLRRKMLLALVNKEKYHEDEKMNNEIFEKYDKYKIPPEEAEWFGLTERQAVQKQRLLEEEIVPVPLKHVLRAKLIEELKAKASGTYVPDDTIKEKKEQSGVQKFLSKINPFSNEKDRDY